MKYPNCMEMMTQGIVTIHHDPAWVLGGSAHRDKHLYFMPRGDGGEELIASARDMTEAYHCQTCSLTVITANSEARP